MAARGGRRPVQPKAAQDAEKAPETPGTPDELVEPADDQSAPGADLEPVQGDAVREQVDASDGETPEVAADDPPVDEVTPDPEPQDPATTERTLGPDGDTDELDQVEAELAAVASAEPVPGESLVEIEKLGEPSPTGTLLPNQVENTVGVAPSQAIAEASASPEGTAAKRAGLDDWPDGVEFVTRHSSMIVYGASTPVRFADGRAVVDDTEQLDAVAAVADEFDIKVAVPVRFILQAMAEDEDDQPDGAETGSGQS